MFRIRSDDGPTLETSAIESLYGDQILINSVDQTKYSLLKICSLIVFFFINRPRTERG